MTEHYHYNIMNNWMHYTNSFNLNDETVDKILKLNIDFINNSSYIYRPIGIWLSYNDEWLNVCKDDNSYYSFDPACYYAYEFDIRPDANILYIKTFNDLLNFAREFTTKINYTVYTHWKRVMLKYDGIVILNYENLKKAINSFIDIRVVERIAWVLKLKSSCACIFKPNTIIQKNRNAINYSR